MASSVFANQPWHTEQEFENRTRILIGESDTDDVDELTWASLREDAEAEVLSSICNLQGKPLRDMLNRVPGELIPQYGTIQSNQTNYPYTVMLPEILGESTPFLWKNLDSCGVMWKERFTVAPLIAGVDYEFGTTGLVIKTVEVGDSYCFEYDTTLNPLPPLLRKYSIMKTAGNIILAKYGTEHARAQAWARMYGEQMDRALDLLANNKSEIPELARINLYNDWKEDFSQGVESIRMVRC